MVRRERFANDAETTLNGSITNVATSLTVTSATGFPTDGDFRILIESELILVTAVAGAVFTIVRAREGTTGAAHSDTATVTHIVTEEGLTEHLRESADPWTEERQAYRLVDASGNRLVKSNFTQVNFTNTTDIDHSSGAISIENDDTPGSGNSLRMLIRTAPSTPYTVEACVEMGIGAFAVPASSSGHYGIVFRESGTNKIVSVSFRPMGSYAIWNWTSPTAFSAEPAGRTAFSHFDKMWMKIEADGTNLNYSISHNGVNYIQLLTTLKATFFTTAPDQVGFYYSANSAFVNNRATLLSWSE